MTAHVVSFTPAGAPTRAVCAGCGWEVQRGDAADTSVLTLCATNHAWLYAPDSSVEFAGLPPVEVTA